MKTEYHKRELEEEKATLESEMGNIGRKNPAVPDDWEPVSLEAESEPDVVDQAGATASRENNAAILADLEARYDTVLAALSRIEKGTYGRCEVCGGQVEAERLEADPTATTCIAHLG